jgi:DNA-directed RNA polymerase specialized sigma24 family protein
LSTEAFSRGEAGLPDDAFLFLAAAKAAPAPEPLGGGLALWAAPGLAWRPQSLPRPPGEGQPDGGEAWLPPAYLAVLPLPSGAPPDPEVEGYRYLCGYARHAIRAAERRVGPLLDHDDIVQQICVEWLEQAGPPQEAFPKLLEKSPVEMRLLREAVRRVIARVIYQRRRHLRARELADLPAPADDAAKDWAEFKSDCQRGVGNLTPQEWQVLELRRQGKTFAEIGSEIRVPRQRVWEIYREVEARLQQIYGKNGV